MKLEPLKQTQERQLPISTSAKYQGLELRMLGKYHRAAYDGYIDMLCDASKRDANLALEDSLLTPTLIAAQQGHLEALRILVGRGGDPERTCVYGLSALHLAAQHHHLNCVSFLVNFGVNMWALDNELHTAKDLAAMGEHKEVLDYLDQVMAKQSALNTKKVQKLKENAKTGAEKRLKQARKAQLKAIKQVEKDERYLIKLSANRRLLKAAHSISDIKLVGRGEPGIRFLPQSDLSNVGQSVRQANLFSSSSRSNGSQQTSKSASLASRLSQSSSISNLLNQRQNRLHLDLLGVRQWRKQSALQQTRGSNQEECTYSSSVSTTSGYTSSQSVCSSLFNNAQAKELKPKSNSMLGDSHFRPRYSELVALGRDRVGIGPTPSSAPKEKISGSKSSNSSLGNKVKGIGGVSRKMQLKRLMLAASSTCSASSQDLAQIDTGGSTSSGSNNRTFPKAPAEDPNGRLCNVQPAIKLKLNAQENKSMRSPKGETGKSEQDISWPPAPSVSRTISEPDFSRALRDASPDRDFTNRQDNEVNPMICLDPPEARRSSSKPVGGQVRSKQRQLLTQCLSQLKKQHLRSTSKLDSGHEHVNMSTGVKHLVQPSNELAGHQALHMLATEHSDELLQHRLSAGDLPLKPSIIKQHLNRQIPVKPSSPESGRITGVDSIGSAGSLAHRGSRTSASVSDKSCEFSPPSSPGYSSSGLSSFELSSDKNTTSGQSAGSSIPVPPPLPALHVTECQKPASVGVTCMSSARSTTTPESIESFLKANGLEDLAEVFVKERIDLEALMLLSEDDLKSLNILLGPRRKLLNAIKKRSRDSTDHRSKSSGVEYVSMVDTDL